MRYLVITALLLASPLVRAEAYRCKQATGTVAFQDHPCQNGASGGIVILPTAQGYAPVAVGPPAPSDKSRAGDAIKAYNASVAAQNRSARCNSARRELGVLKEQRPVYHRDNDGNRVYVEDKDRPGAIAAAQQQVESNCE